MIGDFHLAGYDHRLVIVIGPPPQWGATKHRMDGIGPKMGTISAKVGLPGTTGHVFLLCHRVFRVRDRVSIRVMVRFRVRVSRGVRVRLQHNGVITHL